MKYIHVKNLDKYNPGYTDRNLIWCKIYFSMINASYDFENMDDIDKWRLIALIMLELQIKKPIPYDEAWLQRKISNNKRPIHKTLQVLHNFLELVTVDEKPCNVEENRLDKNRLDKNIVIATEKEFNSILEIYPNKIKSKDAFRHFKASVKTEQDLIDIKNAVKRYVNCQKVKDGFIQNASTWFNNWRDWVDYVDTSAQEPITLMEEYKDGE